MRFRHRAAALLATLTLPLAGLVGLAGEAQAAESATATFAKTQDWGTGFGGNWTVKNTGTTTLNSWTVEWDFPSGTKVTSAWDATVTNSGDHWTAKNVGWNGTLAPGASVSFGFNGSGPGSPSNCKLNGGGCDGTSVPGDAAPSAPGTPTASGITDTSVKLSWSAATDDKGVKNYDVLRDGARIATVTGTTHTDTGLSKGTDYSYTVQARDTADQTGPVSGAVKVRTTGDGGGEPGPSGKVNLGYFTEWGVYGRNYHVKNLVTSGSASKITHINYAFGNVKNGQCTVDDTFAAYEKSYTADQSVSGAADTWDQPLRGNFNQLRQLKAKYPNIKILYSFGGWTYSGGFGQAAQNPAAFAKSCKAVVEDPRWADVFDGIDIDWEYPNACGLTCDSSGAAAFRNLSQALRSEFGQDYLVTAAITGDGSSGGKLDAADYGGAAQYLDWYNVMTYDYFGAFDADGPTAPHSPLTSYSGIPAAGFNSADAIAKLKAKGVPSAKLLLGIGFYGRGWTGVTQSAPGGAATGAAPGTYEAGIEDYKVLKNSCPVTGTVAGTAYAHCGNQWWSYDTPSTIASKLTWAKNQGLGGAFFWEFSGDTSNGELVNAINSGLK
ncbi:MULTISPECIES: glycoside hydrolase family 18 chitinase [Streptomyces]|uniref:glycoside hydrolase family 18 chitinase n=1 Tax=Streptomyces TaxID=1883 RepID=UPI0003A659EA|nr:MULTISPECIES: glycoside hydrolase family 18 chitinase [Streptomyces]AOW89131.1 chitinase [Streptomyces olivaceus]MBZ6114329.1 cellulose binding domain-containing protein [Streptomyces olivaceus]MBZ6128133.1 cellulose binding domain-containing protein [Streptomyces olivaceus]MBZ6149034.1 cellulose binding domain-containing protein [Streptomyces olivaceus]MBZ6162822.1 cellulose binding domain-containing protein [Streptomyces olivaceus]